MSSSSGSDSFSSSSSYSPQLSRGVILGRVSERVVQQDVVFVRGRRLVREEGMPLMLLCPITY